MIVEQPEKEDMSPLEWFVKEQLAALRYTITRTQDAMEDLTVIKNHRVYLNNKKQWLLEGRIGQYVLILDQKPHLTGKYSKPEAKQFLLERDIIQFPLSRSQQPLCLYEIKDKVKIIPTGAVKYA